MFGHAALAVLPIMNGYRKFGKGKITILLEVIEVKTL
jgi:hypothetical protein